MQFSLSIIGPVFEPSLKILDGASESYLHSTAGNQSLRGLRCEFTGFGASIFSNLLKTACMLAIEFILRCLPNPCSTQKPEGYLFVCPAEDFRTGPNLFRWPDESAYWSLDTSGVVHLSPEDAKILGFPIIHTETRMKGNSWNSSIYEGLGRFHQGKGFDPDSQDVARHLDYPLFELSSEEATILACVEDRPGQCDLEDLALCQALGHL
ncbi:hypothetical protein B0H12DRAFT_225307 [Mycena haematopus]|nr:hypothetical protein B0H12DRAFT_225307 [Mycena haematopus]